MPFKEEVRTTVTFANRVQDGVDIYFLSMPKVRLVVLDYSQLHRTSWFVALKMSFMLQAPAPSLCSVYRCYLQPQVKTHDNA